MDATTDYETSSGMSKATIVAARDTLLAQKSLTIAVFDESAVPDLGISPFIRRHDGLYIYTSHLAGHVQALLAQNRASFINDSRYDIRVANIPALNEIGLIERLA